MASVVNKTCCVNTLSGGITGCLSGVSVSAFDNDTLAETGVDLLVGCGIGLVVGGSWEGGKTCLLSCRCCKETGEKMPSITKKCCSVWGKQVFIGGLVGLVDGMIEISSEGKSSTELIKDFSVGCATGALLGSKSCIDKIWRATSKQNSD